MKAQLAISVAATILSLGCREGDTSAPTYRAAEQEVVRSLLDAEFTDTAEHTSPPEVVLRDHFVSQDSLSVEGAITSLRDSVPQLPRNVEERFRRIQGDTSALSPFAIARGAVFLFADSARRRIFAGFQRDTLGWTTFRREHPRANGVVSISRVALSNDGTWALLYAGRRSDYLAGRGFLYVLRKDGGVWRIIERAMLWVS